MKSLESRRNCLKTQGAEQQRKTSDIGLSSSLMQSQASIAVDTGVHAYNTHTQLFANNL